MKRLCSKLYTGFIFLFLYAPIFVVIIFSFNSTKSRTVFEGFTLKWYAELFADQQIMKALGNSLILALSAAFIATMMGTMAAVCINRMKKRTKDVVMNVTYLPIVNSEVVTGVSLMLLFVFVTGIINAQMGAITVLIAHVTFCVPYVILNVLPKLRQVDPNLIDAAMDLGCNHREAFFKAMLPQIMPGIISAWLMAFSLSFDDFAISYFTSGSSFQTLPVAIYSMTRKRITPKINALFAVIFVLIFIVLLAMNIRDSRAERANRFSINKSKENRPMV